MRFDLTQLRKDGEWAWFHIWTYGDKNPSDLSAPKGKMDLLRGELLTVEVSCDYENVHYELVSEGNYYGMVVFYAYQEQAEKPEEKTDISVSMDVSSGVPTLVVKGKMPENAGCLKLHGEANGADLYWDNVSKNAGSFEFRAPLSDLPLKDTPWVWFHIYAYAETAPADKGAYAVKTNLPRGDGIKVGQYIEYNDVRYSVIGSGDSTQLVIQPTEAPKESKLEITGVSIDQNTGLLVVTGNVSSDITDIKISADTKKNGAEIELLGEQAVIRDGTFEASFDLTQLLANNEWAYFHVCYGDNESVNLPREGYLPDSGSVVYQDVKYEIIKQDRDQLILRASEDTEE